MRKEIEIQSVCTHEGGILKMNVRLCHGIICSSNVERVNRQNRSKKVDKPKKNCIKSPSDILDIHQEVFSFYMR